MLKKAMAFADGENLVFRYQEMLKSGRKPKEGVVHVQDCFVWSPSCTTWTWMDLIRFSYYTSVTGDDDKIRNVTRQISETTYRCNSTRLPGRDRLIPRVYKKMSNTQKQKIIDIGLTIDVMRATLGMPIDGIFLLSGDNDYAQLIQEISRRSSKQIYLAAFSSGLGRDLVTSVERFIDLDKLFFEKS